MLIRPLRADPDDLAAGRGVTAAAFDALGRANGSPPELWPQERVERFDRRVRHLVQHDPQGCWAAEHDGRLIGVGLALRREGLWGLSLLAVAPQAQGQGAGRMLLERCAEYGSACLRGIICSTPDPRAARRYRKARFTLHPTMQLHGRVDRARLPGSDGLGVHEGSAAHLDLLDSVDRRVRGAGHGADHEAMLASWPLLVVDTLTGSGYCYLNPTDGGAPGLLAATSRRVATRLLWEALARCPDDVEVTVGNLTAEQEWALDVGLAAGLTVTNAGYVCVRGMRPPAPYIPSGSYL